ncbi:hypothetical protein C8Q70DRAFT_1053441 [Cubamyces menziesii]|uniref:Protein kinase domain-containing protein n=1 Tax=Trametes cubensis TaxID=1111947 RepID=A0AAD7XGH6_9APHY|nr:hypothetical protein C8Q70DRAFT_1053441 [Cubamyces menziesii]KAJ8497032.1 hypothetical protein ONZ51_g752 [Trametes cubensis]
MIHGYESHFNFSSHILKFYPETSPWDLTPEIFSVRPKQTAPCLDFPDSLKPAALEQAKKSKLNPFHFMCGRNPFVLDMPPPPDATIPVTVSEAVPPLMSWSVSGDVQYEFVDELHVGDSGLVYRIRAGHDVRVFKLHIGQDASIRFRTEMDAYAYLASRNVVEVIPQCFGWIELGFLLECARGVPSRLLAVLREEKISVMRGLVFEDLVDAQRLSVHNISLDVGESALQALHQFHSAYILHGKPVKDNVLVFPETKRVVWVGFSHAVCQGSVTREALLAELAEGWAFIYQRLVPDGFIGWEPGPDAIDPRTLVDDVAPVLIQPTHHRPSKPTIKEETVAILASYPDINLFSWDPPIFHLTPGPRRDHQYDTDEFLEAVKVEHRQHTFNPFGKWYGPCPCRIDEPDIFTGGPDERCVHGASVQVIPIRQIPTETQVEFVEYLKYSSNHPLLRVRIGSAEYLLKIFSMNWKGKKNHAACKPRFMTERDAYSHLTHHGACAAGAVPQCHGWFELSRAHVDNANAAIRRAYADEPPPWLVSPVFEDGSPSAAIVLEYLPESEEITLDNVTPARAELAVRSLSRVHCSYVVHGDVTNMKNLRLIRGHGDTPDRVVVLDFDHSRMSSWKRAWPLRIRFYNELMTLWAHLYSWMIPMQRTYCKATKHPHAIEL